MAKKRMVTRTIETINMEAEIFSRAESKLYTQEASFLNGTKKKEIADYFNNNLNEGDKLIEITEKSRTQTIYGMTEEEFLKHAEVVTRPASQTKKEKEE